MTLDYTLDGRNSVQNVSSDMPLSLVLKNVEKIGSISDYCDGKLCGNCIVLMDGQPVLSCLVPAFEARGKEIETFDSFSMGSIVKDIFAAYRKTGITPCKKCIASRTMLIEGIMRRYLEGKIDNPPPLNEDEILSDSAMIRCSCMVPEDFLTIVKEVYESRRNRRNNVR